MKYKVENVLDGALDDVVEICLDRSRDVEMYTNVTETKILKKEKKGNKLYMKLETVANGDIPPKLRKLLSPKMLTWTEENVFDYDTYESEYKVKTHYFTNVCNISGKFKYFEKDGKTVRQLEGEIKVNIPILGPIAEKKIIEVQKENLKLDVNNIRKELAKKKK